MFFRTFDKKELSLGPKKTHKSRLVTGSQETPSASYLRFGFSLADQSDLIDLVCQADIIRTINYTREQNSSITLPPTDQNKPGQTFCEC